MKKYETPSIIVIPFDMKIIVATSLHNEIGSGVQLSRSHIDELQQSDEQTDDTDIFPWNQSENNNPQEQK